MRIVCDRDTFRYAFTTAAKAVATKSTVIGFQCVLVESGEDCAVFKGYGGDIGICVTVPAEVQEPGKIMLNAKSIGNIIAKLPDGYVEIADKADRSGNTTIQIACGMANYSLANLNADDFPSMPTADDGNTISLSQSELRALLDGTLFSVSTDASKPIHTGCLFEVSGNAISVVSTDGFRLSVRNGQLSESSFPDANGSFVVPAKTLTEVVKILDVSSDATAKICVTERHITVAVGDTTITSARIAGTFFNYRAAIPKSSATEVTVSVKDITACVDSVASILDSASTSPLKCTIADNSVVMNTKSAIGDAVNKVDAAISGAGELTIGFNFRYLKEVLKATRVDNVVMKLNSATSPCVIASADGEKDFLYMILPVRLKVGA